MAVVVSAKIGALKHGSTVTLVGSGFGVKSPAAPRVWDNCSGSDPLTLWDGFWPTQDVNYNLDYRSAQRGITMPHSRTTQYLCGCHYGSGGFDAGYNVLLWKNRTVSLPVFTFASWRQRFDDNWTFGLGSPADDNLKIFDYSTGTSPFASPDNWYTEYNSRPTSNVSSCFWHWADDNSSLSNPDTNGHSGFWDTAVNPMSGAWSQIELINRYAATGGVIVKWENGTVVMNYAGPTDLMAGTARCEAIGGYARSQGSTNNWRYYTDIYLDDTSSHVVLGNGSTYNGCTIREPQIPITWSSTSISFTVNLGSFGNTDTAWAYVMDASGATNANGFQVKAGSSGRFYSMRKVLS